MPKAPQKVGCYVDGFNLYYGLRDSSLRRYLWLDVQAMAQRVVLPHQQVVFTKYFTARVSGGKPTDSTAFRQRLQKKRKRQATYLEALEIHCSELEIFEGHFLRKEMRCNNCQSTWPTHEEKMTDVNLATELLVDAFANNFDTAMIVSADSDLVPPIRAVRQHFAHKRVIVAFPPGRNSVDLKNTASGQFVISKGQLKKSQLPETIQKPDGHSLSRPRDWS